MFRKIPPIGAEMVRSWTGASVHVMLLSRHLDEEYKYCCAVICKDAEGTFSASKFLHSHLTSDEIMEILENPGNMGMV